MREKEIDNIVDRLMELPKQYIKLMEHFAVISNMGDVLAEVGKTHMSILKSIQTLNRSTKEEE